MRNLKFCKSMLFPTAVEPLVFAKKNKKLDIYFLFPIFLTCSISKRNIALGKIATLGTIDFISCKVNQESSFGWKAIDIHSFIFLEN